jgi:protein-S-isoprenylcysteine O-methyltransferase Ste14
MLQTLAGNRSLFRPPSHGVGAGVAQQGIFLLPMLRFLPMLAFSVVIVCWLTFAIIFLTHKKPAGGPAQKRESKSIVGIVLQGAGYALIWIIHRPLFSPITQVNRSAEIALAIFTSAIAICSVWFCAAALKALGKQWSLQARVVKDHRLVTECPYSIVRNPIYTGMLGMLIATGLAVSHWVGLLSGLGVFIIGTFIRVRSEEKLLRETFGSEWDAYARSVPAVVPFLV